MQSLEQPNYSIAYDAQKNGQASCRGPSVDAYRNTEAASTSGFRRSLTIPAASASRNTPPAESICYYVKNTLDVDCYKFDTLLSLTQPRDEIV